MSCIQLSEKHIAAVARGLAFILNGPAVCAALPHPTSFRSCATL